MEITHLSLNQFKDIHHDMVAQYGHEQGIANEDRLKSLIEAAHNENDLFKAAAIYASNAKAQNYQDGNRRTGWASSAIFLRMNGYKLKPDLHKVPDFMTDIKKGKYNIDEIASALKNVSKEKKPKTYDEARQHFENKYRDLVHGMSNLPD